LFFKRPHNPNHHGSHEESFKSDVNQFPAILPRPSLGFFLIDLQQLKIICWENRCLILDHDQASSRGKGSTGNNSNNNVNVPRPSSASSALLVEVFSRNLCQVLQSSERGLKGCAFDSSWHKDVIRECATSNMPRKQVLVPEVVPFEMLTLDNALHTVIGKFNRHLKMIRPIFNVLLEETVKNPSDKILRRIMAFRKSLLTFEQNVLYVEESVNKFLSNDLDMSSLYLSEKRDISEHEEVELLLEGYRLDLQEIQLANQTMLGRIDETKEFINTQLNESRNRIIRMSLNIEMCMLGLTFGACFASIFGMNLKSGLEDHELAFYITVGSIIVSSTLIICFLIWRCVNIMDLSNQPNHPILKNFFKYIDILEFLRLNKGRSALTRDNFNDHLISIINKDVSPEDVDLIYLIFDQNNGGKLSKIEFDNIMQRISTDIKN